MHIFKVSGHGKNEKGQEFKEITGKLHNLCLIEGEFCVTTDEGKMIDLKVAEKNDLINWIPVQGKRVRVSPTRIQKLDE